MAVSGDSRLKLSLLPEQAVKPVPAFGRDLPARLTSLIGREREAAAVRETLSCPEVRLLTLTGPGGVGKTRLGIRVAEDLSGDFTDGIRFISLDLVGSPELLISAIVRSLKLREAGPRPPLELLKAYLRDRQLLLLLDNFEHVAEAAPVVTELLGTAPHLKVLVTSRAVLNLSGEHELPVPPLELPDGEGLSDPGALAACESVALFMERAKAVKPDLRLTAANAGAVAGICARVDGLPLAIELAAVRVKLLSPHALLARLENRLQILTCGPRDLPARQRTLRDTIRWSHELLNENEQRLFQRLSVFVGGCALHAAETVCGVGDEPEVLEGVTSLIDKSLLHRAEKEDNEPCLMMLQTIREYALECLTASGEEENIRQAHADYYLAQAEEAEPELAGEEQAEWLGRLEADHYNLRAALSWLLERKDVESTLRLGGALWRFWYARGHLSEGRRWLGEALALSDGEETSLLAKALNGAGHLAWTQGDFERAVALREGSLALSRRLKDRAGVAASLNGLSCVARMRGDYGRASALGEEALNIYRELGDKWGTAESLFLSGVTAAFQGDQAVARSLLEEALMMFREVGDQGYIADTVGVLGIVALDRGDRGAARSLAEESRLIFENLQNRQGIAKAVSVLGDLALDRGDTEAAHDLYEKSLVIFKELDDRWWIPWGLEGLAGVAAAQRRLVRAARLFGAAEALRDALSAPGPAGHRAICERSLATIRDRLDEATFAAAWTEGRAMTAEQALTAEEAEPLPEATIKPQSYPAGLTAREVEVLRLVTAGLTNAQIAQRLFISPRTVNAHLNSIYSKLGLNSRSAATRFAVEHNLV